MAASQGPLAQVAEGRERLKLFWAAEGVEFRDVWASLSQVRAWGPKREGVGVGGGGVRVSNANDKMHIGRANV